jgi:hypothetical protein
MHWLPPNVWRRVVDRAPCDTVALVSSLNRAARQACRNLRNDRASKVQRAWRGWRVSTQGLARAMRQAGVMHQQGGDPAWEKSWQNAVATKGWVLQPVHRGIRALEKEFRLRNNFLLHLRVQHGRIARETTSRSVTASLWFVHEGQDYRVAYADVFLDVLHPNRTEERRFSVVEQSWPAAMSDHDRGVGRHLVVGMFRVFEAVFGRVSKRSQVPAWVRAD